jgi:hypothetical protein
VLCRAVGAEEVDFRAEREHQVVVGQGLDLGKLHRPLVEIDSCHRRLVNRGVVLVVHEVPKRVADARRLEQAGRELVQQRLKRVVVVVIDQHHVGVRLLQLLRRADAGEAAAQDHDPRTSVGRHVFALAPRNSVPPSGRLPKAG